MAEFALCLTHDVDRPYKTYQAISDALIERDLGQLAAFRPGHNPYWQFESLMGLEDDLGVRSAFYFLSEPGLRNRPFQQWCNPRYWIEHLGRYDVETIDLTNIVRALDAGGWEVGLHGSFNSFDDRDRLREEKAKIERALGHEVTGGRQHFLNLAPGKETWRHHRAIGLDYDSSLGSSTEYGFQHGHEPLRPFDDEFVVFPLTAMETALVEEGDFAAAWDACEGLLTEAADNDAVMTVLWHPRLLSDDFPGYRELYRRLIERALELDAWVGPPGELYERLDDPELGAIEV
ncbi:polysaccharide deacetylase family protein [Halococcus salifodinae]|uniref:polysaccharide deacetylase family protein n=1 Tax=Halococcus salifodinae TaxID=36738 RepID=UPI003F830F1E